MAAILLIEDDVTLRRTIARLLCVDGHDVTEARNGRDGMRLLKKGRSEIVLTDIVMQLTDGIEIILANRALPHPLKVIAMAGVGLGGLDYLAMARALGADATLRKPFRIEALRAAIRKCADDSDYPARAARPSPRERQAEDPEMEEEQELLFSIESF